MSLKSHYYGLKYGFVWWFCDTFVAHFPSKRIRIFALKILGVKFQGQAKFFTGFHVRNPKGLVVGDGVSVGPNVLLDARKGLTIGDNAVIAYEAIVWTLNHDYNDVNFCGKGAPVNIGAYAWICSRSIIMPGLTIGEGAVVASGAVVTKDVPPYSIVAGVPARVIGQREKKQWEYGYSRKKDIVHMV